MAGYTTLVLPSLALFFLYVCVSGVPPQPHETSHLINVLGCHEPLCGQRTSFYNEATGLLEFFVSNSLTASQVEAGGKICIMIDEDPSMYCYADEHGRVQVDMVMSSFQSPNTTNADFVDRVVSVRRSVHLHKNDTFLIDSSTVSESHFIMMIPADEGSPKQKLDPSLMAYTHHVSPRYGSIVSRRFVMDYESNAVAREQAGYVIFNVDGVFKGEIDPMQRRLQSGDSNHDSSSAVVGSAGSTSYENNKGEESNLFGEVGFVQGIHVEPASWFFRIQPALNEPFLQAGGLSYPSFGYLEWVLERHAILKGRVFGHLHLANRRSADAAAAAAAGKKDDSNDDHVDDGDRDSRDDDNLTLPVSTKPPLPQPHWEGEEEAVRVCLWTSANMDGQKRIWLRQIEHLSLPPYSNGDSGGDGDIGLPLQFVVLMSTESAVAPDEGDASAVHAFNELVQEWHHHHKAATAAGGSADSSMSSSNGHQHQHQQRHYPRLAALNEYERRLLNIKLSDDNKGVEIKRAPMLGTTIGRSELGQPFDGRPSPLAPDAPVEEVLRFVQSRFREHLAAFEEEVHNSGNSSERGAAADLSKLEPVWVRDVYLRMISLFDANRCSVSVHGNLRGFNPDFLIRDAARYLHIPTVSELLNLFPDRDSVSDVVVGPSRYSLEHGSMRSLRQFTNNPAPATVVGGDRCGASSAVPLPAFEPAVKAESKSALSAATPAAAARKKQKRRGRKRKRKATPAVVVTSSVSARQVILLDRHGGGSGSGSGGSAGGNVTATSSISLYRHRCGPLTTIISPAVDSDLFSPIHIAAAAAPIATVKYPGCDDGSSNSGNINGGCFIVGFVARLSSEKNPGLFVQMASALIKARANAKEAAGGVQHNNSTNNDNNNGNGDRKFRFLMIGDGHLRDPLIELTKRYGIQDYFSFVGWVSAEQLPNYLRAVDVMVNPSVRGWSETFCIANIEAMSVGVPLVTFGVGGVGEYVALKSGQAEHLEALGVQAAATADRREREREGERGRERKSNTGAEKQRKLSEQRCVVTSPDGSCTQYEHEHTDEEEEEEEEEETKEGNHEIDDDEEQSDAFLSADFTVTKNAVLVHSAHPSSLAAAVLHLYGNASIGASLGVEARETVMRHFQPADQLWKYADLYRFVAGRTAQSRMAVRAARQAVLRGH